MAGDLHRLQLLWPNRDQPLGRFTPAITEIDVPARRLCGKMTSGAAARQSAAVLAATGAGTRGTGTRGKVLQEMSSTNHGSHEITNWTPSPEREVRIRDKRSTNLSVCSW